MVTGNRVKESPIGYVSIRLHEQPQGNFYKRTLLLSFLRFSPIWHEPCEQAYTHGVHAGYSSLLQECSIDRLGMGLDEIYEGVQS